MKLFRKMSALTMVLVLLLSMSISVFAADYDAATIDDLMSAFSDTSGEDVNINVTADIDGSTEDGYYGVVGQEGINYNIGSENGSSIGSLFVYGGESVTVDTDVEEFIHFDSTNATLNGAVNGDVNAYDSNVEINSDVNGSISAYGDGSVDVAGNVTATGEDNWVGVSAGEGATVTVGGDVTSSAEGVSAWGDATVTVGGDVVAGDNLSYEGSDYVYGGTAVNAGDNATVTVGGDAVGGNAEGESYALGGSGVSAWGDGDSAPTVTVGGNVVGGNASSTSEEPYAAQAGSGVQMSGSANVTVGGDAVGGNTEGTDSLAMPGAMINCNPGQEAGSLTVNGNVAAGEGTEELGALYVNTWVDPEDENAVPGEVPAIDVGSADSVSVVGFGEEEDARLQAELEAAFVKKDTFHADALWLVRNAEPGSEVTIYAGDRHVITKELIQAVIENEITLTVKWNGGEDVVIDKTISGEFTDTYVKLADLAELLKK